MSQNRNIIKGCRPGSEQDITQLAENTLRKAGAIDRLPTPIDDLIEASKVKDIADFDQFKEGFFSTLTLSARESFESIFQKIRGIADLREKAIYIPKAANPIRHVFPKAHELGHQVIPWHNIDPAYTDDDATLSPRIEIEFEREANFFASEVIFQGKRFGKNARDYQASFEAIFKLSDLYGASKFSTIWRYVEEQDEVIAIAIYYPNNNTFDEDGKCVLDLWRVVPSSKFIKKYDRLNIPSRLRSGDPWVAARDLNVICDGKDALQFGDQNGSFHWQAWWNHYSLFVLLRHAPAFGVIGKILRQHHNHRV